MGLSEIVYCPIKYTYGDRRKLATDRTVLMVDSVLRSSRMSAEGEGGIEGRAWGFSPAVDRRHKQLEKNFVRHQRLR